LAINHDNSEAVWGIKSKECMEGVQGAEINGFDGAE